MQKDFSKINVLVVDDMATAREYISKQLRDIGVINISTASSIVDAFKKINDRIHLIICDYYLGDGRNGKDFIEELRKEEKISDSVVCIMVTAEARFESVIGSAENGIEGYFLKPWNPEIFRDKIEKIIEKREVLIPIYNAIEKNEYRKALQICDLYLADTKKFWYVELALRKLRAEVLIRMGMFQSAIANYDLVLKQEIIPWALHGKAKCLIKLSQYKEAEMILLELIKNFPHYMACYDDLIALYEIQQDYPKQETILTEAIKISWEKYHRHKKLAEVAIKNENPEVAQNMLGILHTKWRHSPHVDSSSIYTYLRVLRLGWKEKEANDLLSSLKTSFRTDSNRIQSLRAIDDVFLWKTEKPIPIDLLPPEDQS